MPINLRTGQPVKVIDDRDGITTTTLLGEIREIPAVPGPGGRDAAQVVRTKAPGSAWFDTATGRGYQREELHLAVA